VLHPDLSPVTGAGVSEGAAVADAEHQAIAQRPFAAHVVIACPHNHDWEPDMAEVPDWQRALAPSVSAAAILTRVDRRSRRFSARIDRSSGILLL